MRDAESDKEGKKEREREREKEREVRTSGGEGFQPAMEFRLPF